MIDKKVPFLVMKRSVFKDNIIPNVYIPNNNAAKYTK